MSRNDVSPESTAHVVPATSETTTASATATATAIPPTAEAQAPAADRFAACVAADRPAPLLLQDVIFAATSKVNGTPAFNINNEQSVMGLKSFEEWKELLDRALAAKKD